MRRAATAIEGRLEVVAADFFDKAERIRGETKLGEEFAEAIESSAAFSPFPLLLLFLLLRLLPPVLVAILPSSRSLLLFFFFSSS